MLAFVAARCVAALVSAAFGPLALRLGDVISAGRARQRVPHLDAGRRGRRPGRRAGDAHVGASGGDGLRRREVVEGAIVLVALVVLAELPSQRDVPYIVFPVLLWAALRFGPRGAATAVLVVCSIAVWNTAQNDGPFVRESLTDSLLATQLFIATAAVTSLLLAAVTAERTRAARALAATEAAQRALADEQAALRRVATLVAGEAPPSRVFEQVTEEVGRLLGLPGANVMQYDGVRTRDGRRRWSEDGRRASRSARRSSSTATRSSRRWCAAEAPQRVERYEEASGTLAETVRRLRLPRRRRRAGHTSADGCGACWRRRRASDEPLPEGLEQRLCDFADLVAQALANADAYEKLAASRARAGRGRRRRAPAARAQPARRRPAAARLGRARAEHGRRRSWNAIRQPPASCSPRPRTISPRGSTSCASWPAASIRSMLTERGLGAALDALLARAPVPVEITTLPERAADGAGRGGRVLRRRGGDHQRRPGTRTRRTRRSASGARTGPPQ